MSQQNTPSSSSHPKGLYLLFATEMWERFSYYGMRAIFVLYMTQALVMNKALASAIYGDYTGLVYLTPLLGGYLADRYWGNRKSIIIGGLVMAIGQFCMFISASSYTSTGFATGIMFLGLAFLIFGNGFFKPNISTMVGSLYPKGDRRIDSAFSIFYMGINAGALIAPLVCGGLGDTGHPEDFRWGFLSACIGMLLSVVIFIYLKDKYIVTPEGEQIGLKPEKVVPDANSQAAAVAKGGNTKWLLLLAVLFIAFKGYFNFDYIFSFICSCCIVAPLVILSDPSLTKIEKNRIQVIFVMAFFVICFWAAFEQAGASLTFFAEEQTDRNIFGFTIPASFFQVINPTFIVILAPIIAMVWGYLNKKNREPASLIKQALGLALVAVGYIFINLKVKGMDPEVKASMMWLFGLYFIHTVGELCLSPIGLSMVNRLAPVRLASLMMGVWFLANAIANKVAGDLSGLYPEDVHAGKAIKAATFQFQDNTDTLHISKAIALDSTMNVGTLKDGGVWKISLPSDNKPKEPELSFTEQFMKNLKSDPLITALQNTKEDTLVSITQVATTSNVKLEPYKLRQLIKRKDNGDMPTAADGIYRGYSEDGKTMYVLNKNKTIKVCDLNPEKPKFLGSTINNLYEFFNIFAIMAAVSGIILFLLTRKLLKMMHGIR